MISKEIIRNKSYIVNLYCIKKMLGYTTLDIAERNLKEDYEIDNGKFRILDGRCIRSIKVTFEEYVNLKRNAIEGIMGYRVIE